MTRADKVIRYKKNYNNKITIVVTITNNSCIDYIFKNKMTQLYVTKINLHSRFLLNKLITVTIILTELADLSVIFFFFNV